MSPSQIPPLSQSRHETMSCPEFYVLQELDGVRQPDSLFSDRGTEIHRIMSRYVMGCTEHKVQANWKYFDRLAEAAGPDAGVILDGMRDNYIVDWEHTFSCELRLAMDDEMQPLTKDGMDLPQFLSTSYEGTLDVLKFMDEQHAHIDDYKSHWRPFDADTFQSKLYPFLVFINFPSVQEVTFELIFVRFKNARRSVTYTREDLPKLAAEIERSRKRQKAFHAQAEANRKSVPALPGPHCIYCPHLPKLTCPLGKMNPYDETLTLEDRLKHVVWMQQARPYHLEIIKAHVSQFNMPVTFEDGNGQKQVAAFQPTESGYFPLIETANMLQEWVDCGDDPTLLNGLRVGSSQLKSKLKAKKRAALDQRIRDTVMVAETKVKFSIKSPDGSTDDGRPDYGEEW
jgi:hypothetical protein